MYEFAQQEAHIDEFVQQQDESRRNFAQLSHKILNIQAHDILEEQEGMDICRCNTVEISQETFP